MTHVENSLSPIKDYRTIDVGNIDRLPPEVITRLFQTMHGYAGELFTAILTRDLPPPPPVPTLDEKVAAYVLSDDQDGKKHIDGILRRHITRYDGDVVRTLADSGLLLSKEGLSEEQLKRYCNMLASLVVAESVCSDAFTEDQKSRVLFGQSTVVDGVDGLITKMWPYNYASIGSEFNTPNIEAYRRAVRLVTDIYTLKFADVAQATAEMGESDGISKWRLEHEILTARQKKTDIYNLTGVVGSGEHLIRLQTDRQRLRNNLGRVMVRYGAFLAGVQRREQEMEYLRTIVGELKRANEYLEDISIEVERVRKELIWIGNDIFTIVRQHDSMLDVMRRSLFYQKATFEELQGQRHDRDYLLDARIGYSRSNDGMLSGGLLGGAVGLLLGNALS